MQDINMKQHHVIITGTGRSGTTLLIQLLTELGLDTGFASKEGEIVVEGIGVYPDKGFEVYDRPEEIAKGKDPSIEVAVKYLLEQLEKNPIQKPVKPKEPDRSKWHEKMKD